MFGTSEGVLVNWSQLECPSWNPTIQGGRGLKRNCEDECPVRSAPNRA